MGDTRPQAAPPLVSVVTPVYNGEPHLRECIESVLAQTYGNWDFLIFDNCSSDNTAAIAGEYAARDSRIRLVRADRHLPQVPNFNRALRAISADSRYCKMLLADDWMFPRCLEEMIQVAELDPRVAVVGSFSLYNDRVHHHGLPYAARPVFPGPWTVRRYIFDDCNFIGSPTCVLLRSNLVRQREAFFSEDTPAEDVEACLDLLADNDFGFVFQVLTGNRRGNDGFWSSVEDFFPTMLNDYLLVHRLGRRFLSDAEFRVRWEVITRRYYGMLGRAWVKGRSRAFWEYHERWLSRNGLVLDRSLVWRSALRHVLGSLLDPKSTVQAWWRGRNRRGGP